MDTLQSYLYLAHLLLQIREIHLIPSAVNKYSSPLCLRLQGEIDPLHSTKEQGRCLPVCATYMVGMK